MNSNPIRDKTFKYALTVVHAYKYLLEKKEYVLSRQLLKSGTAVGALVREALNAESKMDFIHKLGIAQKECDESIYWLELLSAAEFISKDISSPLEAEANEILKLLRSIIITSKRNIEKEKLAKKEKKNLPPNNSDGTNS